MPVTRNNQFVNEFTNLNQYGKSYGQYVRLLGSARATVYGYSIYEFEVFTFSSVTPSIAARKQAFGTNTQQGYDAAFAFDGDDNTRWSTLNTNNQILDVDLGGTAKISRVYLNWERAFGTDFVLQVSSDYVNWTTFASYYGNKVYYNEQAVAASGRYVRMFGINGGQNSGGFSIYEFKIFGDVTPLPVSLVSFTAAPRGNIVALNWTTATEKNNAGFEVQRSANGTDFTTLAKVTGAGNSQTVKAYQYLDATPLSTIAYYRLKQLDFDGTATYGPVASVQGIISTRSLATISIYPNPTVDQATIEWEASTAGATRWSLTNSNGQLVRSGDLNTQAGHNAQALDLRTYPAGSYVLTVESAGQVLGRTRVQKAE